MDRRAIEYLARRMENYRGVRSDEHDEPGETEARRRRREDGTYMKGTGESTVEEKPERSVETRPYGASRLHKGADDESRRRIGFAQGDRKTHWSEEEFVGDMEESLYHEVDDIFHYLDIMTKVHRKGYSELASAFYEISNEKFICAEFLRQQLKKIGHYNASEHQQLENDLEEIKRMFKEI